ncbi:hypothetical protein GCM10022222_20380 [Amycolatopsis ultiminotia]|uniref:Transposase n=1 Tax=Amycolatopsis ultiminotia TaxID=543629 RepID=A0ABP6VMN8_9PSEU
MSCRGGWCRTGCGTTAQKTGQTARRRAYDLPALRDWLRQHRIFPRIARKGIESAEKLGKHRWVIECTIAWTTGYRRLTIRYERNPSHYLAFRTLGAAITRYKNSPSETRSKTHML